VTNVSFADAGVAWSSLNGGASWTQENLSIDLWLSAARQGDIFRLGVYVEDNAGNNHSNFTIHSDQIGTANYPITEPFILYYASSGGGVDTNKNGTHNTE
jgi:hypothetical protein